MGRRSAHPISSITDCEESVHIPLLFDAASPVLHFDFNLFLQFIFQPSPALLGGLAVTIYASVVAQLIGVILGIFSALAGMAKNRVLRSISGFYVWFFRGTPLLVQMFFIYFGRRICSACDLFPATSISGSSACAARPGGHRGAGDQRGRLHERDHPGRHPLGRSRPDGGGQVARHDVRADDAPDRPAAGGAGDHSAARQRVQQHAEDDVAARRHRACTELFRVAQSVYADTFKPFELFSASPSTTCCSRRSGASSRAASSGGSGRATSAAKSARARARLLGLGGRRAAGESGR